MAANNEATLAATEAGRGWLKNFTDRTTAERLLNSLRVAAVDEVRSLLAHALEKLSRRIPGPRLLMPVRNVRHDIVPYSDAMKPHSITPIAYKTYNPGQGLALLPGSEGWVGNLVRDLTHGAAATGGAWSGPLCNFDDLRLHKFRSIVFVDDNSGSGRQIIDFVTSFQRNPSIRSWLSYKLIRFHLVLFAATPRAYAALEASELFEDITLLESAPTFDTAGWSSEEAESVREMCRENAADPNFALGYKESESLFLTSFSVPNNLPAILWQPESPKSSDWRPLFVDRTVPPSISRSITSQNPRLNIPNLLEELGYRRIAASSRRRPELASDGSLAVLALLSRQPKSTKVGLSQTLLLPMGTIETILSRLAALELVTADGQLTGSGWKELHEAQRKRVPQRRASNEPGSADVYLPSILRSGLGDSI